MRKYTIALLAVLMFHFSCEPEPDPKFIIAEDKVGFLSKDTNLSELEQLFASDSIVRDTLNLELGKVREQIRIYESGGAHLLTVTPSGDSLNTASNIRIHDPRFQTLTGIGINSTYGDIEKAYPIGKVSPAMNNIVLLLKNSNLYMTIDKSQLPESLRYSSGPVEAVQIPDMAKIKYLMVAWD